MFDYFSKPIHVFICIGKHFIRKNILFSKSKMNLKGYIQTAYAPTQIHLF